MRRKHKSSRVSSGANGSWPSSPSSMVVWDCAGWAPSCAFRWTTAVARRRVAPRCAASWAVVRVSCGCWASCPRPATARRSKSGRRGVWAERVIRRCNGSPRPSCWTASGRRCCATPRPWPRSPSRRARRSSPNGRAWPSGRVTRPTISRLRTSRAPVASRSASCEPRSWHRTGSIPRGRHRSSSSIRSCRGSSSTPACWPWPRIRAHRRPRGSASLGSSRPIWTTSWRRRSVP